MARSFDAWLEDLERRHFADLKFSEVTPALRALSSAYVERRETLAERGAFDSRGKRAAYALYYGPLHFLTAAFILEALGAFEQPRKSLLDIGCGTGAAGAAWASGVASAPRVTGIDTHAWALSEALNTYRAFRLPADVRRGDAGKTHVPPAVDAVIAGWTANEIGDRARDALFTELLRAAERGVAVLIVEPIATRVSPWWPAWSQKFVDAGGRADEWKFRTILPPLLRKLDKAAGLRHDELKARSLFVARSARA